MMWPARQTTIQRILQKYLMTQPPESKRSCWTSLGGEAAGPELAALLGRDSATSMGSKCKIAPAR
jgi:hypothetical protein